MATASGRKSTSVKDLLFKEPYRFDFFQAVHVLERSYGNNVEENGHARRKPVGFDHMPLHEIVRFRADPSLSFPPSPVVALRPAKSEQDSQGRERPFEMVVAFLGLTGPLGVLPDHYSKLLIERLRSRDSTQLDFYDLFNHRTVSLFYRAWEKYHIPFTYERYRHESKESSQNPERDLFTECLYSLIGFGTKGHIGRQEINDESLLYYGGQFAHYPRHASGLGQILSDYFNMPVEVCQFCGQWLYLEPHDLSEFPSARHPEGLNCQLGVTVVVGEKIWDVQSKFRLRLGPLDYGQFQRLMPDGDGLRPLCQLTRSYVGSEFDFDVQPSLRPEAVPWCRLDPHEPPKLGWNTWIRNGEFEEAVSDAVFLLEDA